MKKVNKRLSVLVLALTFLVTFIRADVVFADSEEAIGVLYNSYTMEKLDDVYVKNLVINKNEVSMVLNGEKVISLNAEFVANEEIDNEQVDIYYAETNDYIVKIAIKNGVVSGKFNKREVSPSKRLSNTYDNFAFIITLNSSKIDLNSTLLELQNDEQITKLVESNKAVLDNSKNISLQEASTQDMSILSTAYVNARSGSNVAEATAHYRYFGDFGDGPMYNVSTITYICTQSVMPTNHSYVSVWYDIWDSNPIWMGSVTNRTTTESVSLYVNNSSALVAQTGRMGFVKIWGIPIPWFIDDWDITYF